jgi:hypothetical protein
MIGVFVTFRYGDKFDEQAVRKIAETARARFEGMPGLRSKAFTLNSGKREAANFYVWERSSLISYSSTWPVSTECAQASSSYKLPHSWRTEKVL